MTDDTASMAHDRKCPETNATVLDRNGRVWVRLSPDRDPNIWRTEPPSLVHGLRTWEELQRLEGPLVVVTP